MKKTIIFATSNKGKVLSLSNKLPKDKFNIIQKEIDIPEIQADSATEIARFKAKYVFNLIHKPVVAQDSSFHIVSLNGFPGPYIKFVNETLGPEGIIRLMSGEKNRDCYFELALCYIDEQGKSHTFKNDVKMGKIAEGVDNTSSEKAWSSLWKIYIPRWSNKTLSALTEVEIDKHEKINDGSSDFAKFTEWLIAQK